MNPQGAFDVLLIEDDPDHVELTRRALDKSRVQSVLHRVCDGVDALEFLKREDRYRAAPQPDVILLDLNLPRLSGHEVLQLIKADDDLSRIPVVVLTTSEAATDRSQAFAHGLDGYLTKPLDTDALWGIVTRARMMRQSA